MKLKIGDLFLTGTILAAAFMVAAFFSATGAETVTAVVIKDGQELKRINLDSLEKPISLEIEDEYYDRIVAEKGRIRFQDADCPDKVCISTGWISRPGQIAVCLPNRLILKIEGSDSEIDTILR